MNALIKREKILSLIKSINGFNRVEIRNSVVSEMKEMNQSQLFPVLTTLLDESDIEIRSSTVDVILLIDRVEGIPLVLPILDNFNDALCYHVCGRMHSFGDERAIKPLLKVLQQHPDPQTRGVAAYALGGIKDIQTIPKLLETEQNDHEHDWSGHSPSTSAKDAITDILKHQVIKHIVEDSEKMIDKYFDNNCQITGQITYLPSPFIDIENSETPYRNLPREMVEPTETRKIDLISLHPFPFAVELIFTNLNHKVKRDFVFSYEDSRLTIVTIIKDNQ